MQRSVTTLVGILLNMTKDWHFAPKVPFSTILTCIFNSILFTSLTAISIIFEQIWIFKFELCNISLTFPEQTTFSCKIAMGYKQILDISFLVILKLPKFEKKVLKSNWFPLIQCLTFMVSMLYMSGIQVLSWCGPVNSVWCTHLATFCVYA